MTFEELKKEFKYHGFQIDGNSFVHIRENMNMSFNGVHPKEKFEMMYICEGSICDEGDSDAEPLYEFDIMQNGEPVVTICIKNFDDFTRLA